MNKEGILVVLTGFGGVGKGSVRRLLIDKNEDMVFSISVTSRVPRAEDEEGRTYFFKSEEEFKRMIENNELLEWVYFCDNYYGTPKKYITDMIEKGKNVILEIEVEGARRVKEIFGKKVILIYILPPSVLELRKRLLNRGEEEAYIQKRMIKAKDEIKEIEYFDYIVINDTLEEAVVEIEKIVASEKHKYYRYKDFIKNMIIELNK